MIRLIWRMKVNGFGAAREGCLGWRKGAAWMWYNVRDVRREVRRVFAECGTNKSSQGVRHLFVRDSKCRFSRLISSPLVFLYRKTINLSVCWFLPSCKKLEVFHSSHMCCSFFCLSNPPNHIMYFSYIHICVKPTYWSETQSWSEIGLNRAKDRLHNATGLDDLMVYFWRDFAKCLMLVCKTWNVSTSLPDLGHITGIDTTIVPSQFLGSLHPT